MAGLHGAVAALLDKKAGVRFGELMKGLTAENPGEFEAEAVPEAKRAAVRKAMERVIGRASHGGQ